MKKTFKITVNLSNKTYEIQWSPLHCTGEELNIIVFALQNWFADFISDIFVKTIHLEYENKSDWVKELKRKHNLCIENINKSLFSECMEKLLISYS